jgi:hypothetical protein
MMEEKSTGTNASEKTDVERVKDAWGKGEAASSWRTPQRTHWTQHPKVQERLNLLTIGNPLKNRFNYFMERHLQQLFDTEDQLIADGVLKHDFAIIIATRR